MATQYVIFKVHDGEYGMDVSGVSAIETLTSVTPVPNAANHILGIINLRGDVLPVYSLRTKFGMQEEPVNEKTKIIITKSCGVDIAFKVDEVKEIYTCEESALTEFPSIARRNETAYVDKVANNNGRLILLIDPDRVLLADEAEAISEMIRSV